MQNMRIEIADLSPVKKKLDISIPAETVKKEIKAAYQNIKSTANIAGFRKGAAPMSILKARFGDHVQEDVTRRLIENTYTQALTDKRLIPVEAPNFDLGGALDEDKDFSYSITVEVQPSLDINDYKGMDLKREEAVITDEDLERGITNLRQAASQYKEVDKAAGEGDLVVVDFEAFMDGEPIKNGKGTDYPCIIGERTLLPEFDEALKGTKKGTEKEADIKIPDNYSEKHLAGKTAHFKLAIKSVKEKGLPDVDEQFAKDLGCESLEALKAKVRDEMQKHKANDLKEKLKTEILDRLIAAHSFEVPDALVNRYMKIILGRVMEGIRSGMPSPGDEGLSIDQLKEKYQGAAVRSVKEDLILDHIAYKEKIQVSTEEVETSVKNIAAQRGVSFEGLMGRIEREGALSVIQDGLKHEKVFDIIIESSRPA